MATSTGGKRRLEGRVAIVTGAGRGIGRAEALLLAMEGAKVVVNDLGGGTDGSGADTSVAGHVVNEIRANGGTAVANHDSVATMNGGANIVRTAIDSFGRLDILINNAGNVRPRIIYNMSEDDFDAGIASINPSSKISPSKLPPSRSGCAPTLHRTSMGARFRSVATKSACMRRL